ncbi:SpoIIE family protein phosphatase [Alkalithermobacter paradoxus]|uniref:Phosphoserine phosphatase RsbP n=1 Tax=Alkalithermobacter paradoxus TaxID=29349 RepID=A0A1V4I5K9_9FIRM|nr:phosphoserine phosphatase RsbP [[Clostridium] thermoalcaliphilum]
MIVKENNFLNKSELKFHKNLIQDIFNGMVDWVRVVDKTGTVIYVNDEMKRKIGEQIIGSRCYNSLGKDCSCENCITEMTIKTGRMHHKEEIVNGRIYSVVSSPIRDVNNKIYAAVEVFRDVTEEKRLKKEIMQKNDKMSRDLEFAKALQKNMLPRKGIYENISLDYVYRPSEMLSGDIFDVFKIGDNHIGMYISDVVGHGVKASMLTMFIRQMMKCVDDNNLSPSDALTKLHKHFLDLNLDYDKYFTIFFAILDTRSNELRYVNAGHNSLPILFNNEKVNMLSASGNLISPFFDKVEYEEKVVTLSKGDKILFYTDGIIETKGHGGEEFGMERLIDIVKGRNDNILESIQKSVDEFRQSKQEDDLAAFLIELL